MATKPDVINNDLNVNGVLTPTKFSPPAACIADAAIAGPISAAKLTHQFAVPYAQAPGAAVVAATLDLRIVYGATGTVVDFAAAVTGAIATGGDRTVNVDLQKSTGAGAFASILTATLQFTSADSLRTAKRATFTATGLAVGDVLRVVVTVAGAAGNQAQGLAVNLTTTESAS